MSPEAGHAVAASVPIDTARAETLRQRSWLWPAAILLVSAPLVIALVLIIWRTPIPLSEAVALLEDVARRPALSFLSLDTSYYRPLYHMTLSLLWHRAGSIAATLDGIKVLQLTPIVLLVVLLVRCMRPRNARDAAAGLFAVAVMIGMPAFRDNLELPLSYTTVGMPLGLAVWMLLERPATRSRTALAFVLTVVAIGFKEQGLVIVPLVIAMWWMGAPGATRQIALAVAALAVVYVILRLVASGSWPLFQQDVGYGFTRLSTGEAEDRFGSFPLWIFAYSAASTVFNVLFSEPTGGVFRIAADTTTGRLEPWELNHLVSSCVLTALIAGFAIHAWRGGGAPRERRMLVALGVVVVACGALSFNYSRDRLGGMAVPFYAMAAYYAMRYAIDRGTAVSRRPALAAVLLFALAGMWQLRALSTLETARVTSYRNRLEWLIRLPERRAEFADRPVYLSIMEAMVNQGTADNAPRPTRYPRALEMFMRER